MKRVVFIVITLFISSINSLKAQTEDIYLSEHDKNFNVLISKMDSLYEAGWNYYILDTNKWMMTIDLFDTVIDLYYNNINRYTYRNDEYWALNSYFKYASYSCALIYSIIISWEANFNLQYTDACLNYLKPFSSHFPNHLSYIYNPIDSLAYDLASRCYHDKADYLFRLGFQTLLGNDTLEYKSYIEKALSCCDSAIYCYNISEVYLNSPENILYTDYIEYVYRMKSISDSLQANDLITIINDEIGEFFYKNPEQLERHLKNVIELPDTDKYDTLAYAVYPLIWLNRNKRYSDALDYYEQIVGKIVPNEATLIAFQTECLRQLGYYGKELLLSTQHFFNADNGKYTLYDESLWFNIWMYYLREEYHKAIHFCNKALDDEKTTDILMMRGVCKERLSEKTPPGEKRDALMREAHSDYNEVIEIDKREGNKPNPFVYARLGRFREAIKYAKDRCRIWDSIISHNTCTEDDSFSAFSNQLLLAQIYCMSGNKHRAKESLRKALSFNHDAYALSYTVSMPYIEPIKDERDRLVNQYAINNGLRRLEADTILTFIKYTQAQNGTIYTPCTINGIDIDSMTFDSGASIVQISKELADQMRKNGTLTIDDSIRKDIFVFANGEYREQPVVVLHSVKIGDIELHDVIGTITDTKDPKLLLGQTVISNFIITMDPVDQLMTFKQIKYKR